MSNVTRKRKKSDCFDDNECFIPRVGILYDEKLNKEFNKLPQLNRRGELVHSLIDAYGITPYLSKIKYVPATEDDLRNFHSSDFIEFLRNINTLYTPDDCVDLEYGLGYDCPPLDGIYDYVLAIAGSTLSAARSLMSCEVDIAINWSGGWHHAQRDAASGFCYVNDIVLAILEMKHCYNYILYVDLDIHHGNAVEEAFLYSSQVMTLSFHKFEAGYFPGSGGLESANCTAPGLCVNVPLKAGINDELYCTVFDSILKEVLRHFEPGIVVIQCGADGLSGDPLGGFSLTQESYSHCLDKLLQLKLPTLLLGGGGYNVENTARLWTKLTAQVVYVNLDDDIPDHEFFTYYGPGFELSVTLSQRKNENDAEYIKLVLSHVTSQLQRLNVS